MHPLAELVTVEYGNPYDHLKGPILITMKYRIPGYAIIESDQIILKSFVASGLMKRAMGHLYIDTKSETKTYPFRDRCSRQVQLNESITLPGNYSIVYQPVTEKFADATASYDGGYEMSRDGNTLQMNQLANFNKRIYEPQEWPSFRKATLAQTRMINEPVVLKKNQ